MGADAFPAYLRGIETQGGKGDPEAGTGFQPTYEGLKRIWGGIDGVW